MSRHARVHRFSHPPPPPPSSAPMAAVAAATTSLFNGERVVVLLFVSLVVSSLSLRSLLCEAAAVCLLGIAALRLEIAAEGSSDLSRFKTRAGASSGILLGAITLPTVMLSRLVQMSRLVSAHNIRPEELAYLSFQYWAASASCLSILVFLYSVIQRSKCKSNSFLSVQFKEVRLGILYMVCYTVLCCISLGKNCHYGSHVALKLFWIICHGLASVKLIQHILHIFPSCASVGEALLASGGLILYFGDMLACTFAKIDLYLLASKLSYGQDNFRTEISTVVQGLVLGVLVLPSLYKFSLKIWAHYFGLIDSGAQTDTQRVSEGMGGSLLFYALLLLMTTMIAPAWMQFVKDFPVHPLLWIFNFVIGDPFKRLSLCIFWMLVICASILCFYKISKDDKTERILLRKYYHLVAVLMFVPALAFQSEFLDLAFGAALAVFLTLEIIRVWRIWPLGQLVHQFMNAFTDHRDSDILIVSHFSLLLGCALPEWLSLRYNDRPLAPFAGILSLGIGDTMASMVGHKYGVLRWSKTGRKTIEGTAAGIASVLAVCFVLVPHLASTGYLLIENWMPLIVAATVSGLLEAYTEQLDNAFIPLVFYSLLCL